MIPAADPARTRRLGVALLGGLALLLAGGFAVWAAEVLGTKALALPIALAAGMALLLNPFWPLFLLVISVPVDALFNRIFDPLPVSAATALTLLTLGALLLRLPREPREERLLPDDPTLRWTLAFAVALAISALLAQDRDVAYEDAGRLGGQLLMMLLIVRIVRTPRDMRILLFGLAAAALFSALVVIFETETGIRLLSRTGGFDRSRGASDQNPTTAALMQTFGVTMALALGLSYARGRLLTLSAGLVGILGIFLSYARSASLTVAAVALLIAWHHRRSRYFPLGAILAMGAIAAMLPMIPDTFWNRLAALGNFDTDMTLWRRVGYNLIGLDLVAQHPLFGIGPGNFPQVYMDPQYRYMPGRTLEPRDLHNMYLGVAAELGLVGLATFVGVIASGIIRLLRRTAQCSDPTARAFATALLFGSLAYYVGSLVTPAQYVKFTWVLVGLAVAQARLMDPRRDGQ